ncbi:unnamed protein product [Rotaria sp. Silwood2]|nr:unnamed protein product [Rotaria sp. Silwood2]
MPCIYPSIVVFLFNIFIFFLFKFKFYSTDNTFIHGGVDRLGCIEQRVIGPKNISQRINDLNLQDCHAKIRQIDSHSTIGGGVVVQVTDELSNNGDPIRRFMQTFVLSPRQPKKYYVQNDTFHYQDEVFDDGSDEVDEDDRSNYSCSYWRDRVSQQGLLYLSVNYLCFYSNILGKDIILVIKFAGIISIERIHSYVSETMRVCTRLYVYDFKMFRKIEERF